MNISIHPYSIHLKQPLITGAGTFQSRDGWIIKSFIREHSIFSEIAPLPGYSIEDTQDVFTWLSKNDKNMKKHILDRDWINEIPYASVRFGLDVHRLQILASADGKPLHRYLNDKADSKVRANGMISINDPINGNEKIEQYLNQGIKLIKCKVGIKPAQEINLIRMFSERYPDITWRLDANQSFNVEMAVDFLNGLKGYPIEYCEQPTSADNFADLKKVRDSVSVKIAADESAITIDRIIKLIEYNACDVIIIKPMLIGTIQEIISLVELINQSGLRLIFTTSLESRVGRRVVAQIAAAYSQKPDDAHGLATGYLYDRDVDTIQETLSNGFFHLNDSN